jgi:Leucine-rich repeat (LRR) protein
MKVITILLLAIAMTSATTLKCEFTRNTLFGYVCEIRGVKLISEEKVTIEHGDHIQGKTDADVKMISFGKSTVNFVPNQIFAIFPNLEILDLLNVSMTRWNRDFLKNAKNLKRIWLAHNEIRELGDNSFMGATALENLVLHNNKIERISEKAFNGLLQLKSLELQNNLITKLSGNAFSPLKKLKEINLSENKIEQIDGNVFSGASKLEFLNFGDNKIKNLPANLFANQQNLTIVFMQNNQIEKLPKTLFAGCTALMELRFDNNQIKEIPKGFFENNKKFKLFNMMKNQIETFDGKILPSGIELLYLGEKKNNIDKILLLLLLTVGFYSMSCHYTFKRKVNFILEAFDRESFKLFSIQIRL